MILASYVFNSIDIKSIHSGDSSSEFLKFFRDTKSKEEVCQRKAQLIYDIELINSVCLQSSVKTNIFDEDGESIHQINFDYIQVHACALIWTLNRKIREILRSLESELKEQETLKTHIEADPILRVILNHSLEELVKSLYVLLIRFHLDDGQVLLLHNGAFLRQHLKISNYIGIEASIMSLLGYSVYLPPISSEFIKSIDEKFNINSFTSTLDYYYESLIVNPVFIISKMDNFLISAMTVISQEIQDKDQIATALDNILLAKRHSLPRFESVQMEHTHRYSTRIAKKEYLIQFRDIHTSIERLKDSVAQGTELETIGLPPRLHRFELNMIKDFLRKAVFYGDHERFEIILKLCKTIPTYLPINDILEDHPHRNNLLHYVLFYYQRDMFITILSCMTKSALKQAGRADTAISIFQLAASLDDGEPLTFFISNLGSGTCLWKTDPQQADAIDIIGSCISNVIRDMTTTMEISPKRKKAPSPVIFSEKGGSSAEMAIDSRVSTTPKRHKASNRRTK